MKTIHLVWARTKYEGSCIVMAFERKEDADEFRDKCAKYHAKKPPQPPGLTFDAGEVASDKWLDDVDRWRQRHPAGEYNAHADEFTVGALEVCGSRRKARATTA